VAHPAVNARFALIIVAALSLSGCGEDQPNFAADARPQRLSEWNLFDLSASRLRPLPTVEVVRPANPLFTDYAHKLRTLWMPDGTQATLINDEIDYPVGTVLSKTFYYPVDATGNVIRVADEGAREIDLTDSRLIETRILVRQESGWDALPYVWNEDETEAFLRVAGASQTLDMITAAELEQPATRFAYFVPNENQCSGCHTTEHPDGGMHPLGAIASQLTASSHSASGEFQPQIDTLVARGWLDKAPQIRTLDSYEDTDLPLDKRALAYLNMQCGHCHNPKGAADTSGLILTGKHKSLVSMGVCKPPVAAGGGAGDLQYGIVPGDPDNSILHYRVASTKPDEMMPELGRSLVHEEGVALLREWIDTLPGSCDNENEVADQNADFRGVDTAG
jgi:uncharacterized repeat protein (TIGR03806 family)